MNKTSKLFMGFASLAMLAACSDDAPVVNGGDELTTTEGSAYLNITIRDANDLSRSFSRADGDADGGFQNAEGNEGTVGTAYFYFFNDNGNYMGQATVWNGGTTQPNGDNIEFKSPTLVVLENVKDKDTYPTYMITVLNGKHYTNAQLSSLSIDDFGKELTTWGANEENGFVMTTTSFYSEGTTMADHNDTYYYATKLDPTKFARTPELALNNPGIDVYVERLAVRVKLNTAEYLPVTATIFGAPGDNPEVDPSTPDNSATEAATKLCVRIDGWYINGVQKKSRLSKQLGADWDNSYFDLAKGTGKWTWDFPSLHRSYWAMSNNYGIITDTDQDLDTDLQFFPYNNANVNTVKVANYCNENTSTVDNLKLDGENAKNLPNQRKLTSVIIKATVGTGTGADDFEAVNLVEHNGFYYTDDRFIALVLNMAKANIPCTKKVTESDTQVDTDYEPIPVEDMYTIDGTNARVFVKTAYKNIDTDNLWIKKDGVWTKTTVADVDTALKAATADSKYTRRFTGGAMYYNVPIAHLNSPTYDNSNGDITSWKEGTFGVVRNHSYEITINSVKRLGTGVFDPEGEKDTDPIKPTPDPEDPNWFLGAQINILSWKIVNNFVDL